MTERQSARMSKIKNGGLNHYGAGPFEQQQFGTAGVIEGVEARRCAASIFVSRTFCSGLYSVVMSMMARCFCGR